MKNKLSIMLLLFIALLLTGCVQDNNNNNNNDIVATDIQIEAPATATISQGETLQLVASLTPKESNSVVTWSSSDDEIASVSKSGLVTALGVGNVKITASVSTNDGIKSASVDLTINPNLRNVLNSLSQEITLNGTYTQIRDGSLVTSIESQLKLYFNNEIGHQEYYLQESVDDEYVDERHYYGNAKGELVTLQINRLNEVEERNFVHAGSSTQNPSDYILFDDFISKFSDVKDSEVKIVSPNELEINLTNDSAAKDLLYSLSFYETDLTNLISIRLDKLGNPTFIKLEGSYADEDYGFTFLQTLEYNVVTKNDIKVPDKVAPYPELEGDDATLVSNFLEALKNRNYTINIFVDDTSTLTGKVTPNNVLMSDSNNSSRYFSYIADKGVYEVSYNESENAITPKSANSIATSMNEFLTPIDFSKDLFAPLGNDIYTLIYGLDESGLLIGLDPAIPFFDVYNSIYVIRNLSSVNIALNHDGNDITKATISYEGRLMTYLSYQIKVEITNIGSTTVPFEDATVKEYVEPTDWSSLDNEWYESSNELLSGEINNVPYVHTDWNTYLEEDKSLVQTSPMDKETADALLSTLTSLLQNASWTKTEDVYSDRGTTIFDGVYSKDGENIIVAVDEFTSSGDYYLQIVFLPVNYFVPATSWEEVDPSWYSEVNDYLGDDVSYVPFIEGDWSVYPKAFDYYYATIEFETLEEYEEFYARFMEEFENAGWFISEDYVDYNYSEPVYENDMCDFLVYINAVANEDNDTYYLDINFLSSDLDNEDVEWS